MRFGIAGLVLVAGGLVAASVVLVRAGGDSEPFSGMPNALWRVVNYACVPANAIGLPVPCAEVRQEGNGGYAILPVNANHVLTVPTTPIPGIESPKLLDPRQPNYWQAAWRAQSYLSARHGHLPREAVGIAVNSQEARSQDQFHIHTACLKPIVASAIAAAHLTPAAGWSKLARRLPGAHYRVRAIEAADLSKVNVFGFLEPAIRADSDAMAAQTIALAGATIEGKPGFVMLNADARDNMDSHAEALLDFTCALAQSK